MQHWFIYYKLDPAAASEITPHVRKMQGVVGAATGVRTKLMRRADSDVTATLLEVYEQIAEPTVFERVLSVALAQAELPAQLVAQRRTERFEEC